MKKLILVMLGVVFLSGCANVSIIKPITNDQSGNIYSKSNKPNGYVIYEPKVFVHVKRVKNDCKIDTFQMPNYQKPYTVDVQSALFGKIDADIKIVDGWMLGGIGAKIDNTSVVGNIKGLIGLSAQPQIPFKSVSEGQKECQEGIYALEIPGEESVSLKLKKVTVE